MNPDALKEMWRSQTSPRRLAMDTDVLLQQLQRNQKSFEALIIRRDFWEVGISLVMVGWWVWFGLKKDMPWTWYLCIPALLWIAGFMVVDRIRQRRRQPKLGDPLRECAGNSLAQVEHQIWLLRNVLWWYLLPPSVAVGAFFAQVTWMARDGGWKTGLIMAGVITFAALVDLVIYWLNQTAVREELEPRRRELQVLIESLEDSDHARHFPEGNI